MLGRLGYSCWWLVAGYVCEVLEYGICCRYYITAERRWRPEWVGVRYHARTHVSHVHCSPAQITFTNTHRPTWRPPLDKRRLFAMLQPSHLTTDCHGVLWSSRRRPPNTTHIATATALSGVAGRPQWLAKDLTLMSLHVVCYILHYWRTDKKLLRVVIRIMVAIGLFNHGYIATIFFILTTYQPYR